MEVCHIGRALDKENHDSEYPGHLVHLPSSAFAFLLEPLEIRHHHSEELDDDGRGDIRHDSESEYRSITEGTSGKHVQQAHEAFRRCTLESRQLCRIDSRKHYETSKTINQQQKEGITYPLAEFFDPVNILDCLDQSSHYALIRLLLPFHQPFQSSQ